MLRVIYKHIVVYDNAGIIVQQKVLIPRKIYVLILVVYTKNKSGNCTIFFILKKGGKAKYFYEYMQLLDIKLEVTGYL